MVVRQATMVSEGRPKASRKKFVVVSAKKKNRRDNFSDHNV
jgi:hypothetical protein